ncbi:MAG: hypothetical protein Fur0012_00500 [Elusimicrobiota bacterium]
MRRKYKPRLRFKKKKEFALRALLVIVALLAVASIPYAWRGTRSFALRSLEFSKKNISSIRADFGQPVLESEVKKDLAFLVGRPFDAEASSKLENYFSSQKPFISGLSVKHNSFTGTLYVSGKAEKPCALISGDEKSYILSSGRVVKNSDFGEDFIQVFCQSSCTFDPSFATFAGELYAVSQKAGLEILKLVYEGKGKSPRVVLKDGSEVFWGDYSFTVEKIERLKNVLRDSYSKTESPVRADLRFFESGKIIVSKLN